ncbi:unnamed protein product, partial [Iphiclides podalirius]
MRTWPKYLGRIAGSRLRFTLANCIVRAPCPLTLSIRPLIIRVGDPRPDFCAPDTRLWVHSAPLHRCTLRARFTLVKCLVQ